MSQQLKELIERAEAYVASMDGRADSTASEIIREFLYVQTAQLDAEQPRCHQDGGICGSGGYCDACDEGESIDAALSSKGDEG